MKTSTAIEIELQTRPAIEIEPQTKENGVITKNATLQIYTPRPHFGGGSVKWFDDNTLLKSKAENKEASTH